MTKDELIAYAREQYGTEPEYLWESAPNTFVLRHRGNRKWYAVVMDVRRDRLGLPGEDIVYIMDVKCGPLLSGSYIGKSGVVPAYHMNKTHWLGVLLDGSAEALNYRGAFLHPPHECRYTDADFDRVNAALFPNGTDALEVYEWTADWSDFFGDGLTAAERSIT